MSFYLVKQTDSMDCGATCLKMIFRFYGYNIDINWIRLNTYTSMQGVSLKGLHYAAEQLGFKANSYRLKIEDLNYIEHPVILHWNKKHFVVLYKLKVRNGKVSYYIADPGGAKLKVSDLYLKKCWCNNGEGIALIVLPEKVSLPSEVLVREKSISKLLSHLKVFKNKSLSLILSVIAILIVQVSFPFISQNVIDKGIKGVSINVLLLFIGAQFILYSMKILVEFIRNVILLKLSTIISISILSDYIKRCLKRPVSFFENKVIGDFIQRISDGRRIEEFLTYSSLQILSSILTFSIFLPILYLYNIYVFLIYFIGSFIYTLWFFYFFEKRKQVDHLQFLANSESQNSTVEIFKGIIDIKVNTCSDNIINEWSRKQKKVFDIKLKGLMIEQIQKNGSLIINEFKKLFIVFYCVILVVNHEITLGVLFSIIYINAQLDSPLAMMIDMFKSFQNAILSFDRLEEIESVKKEDSSAVLNESGNLLDGDIIFNNVSFRYDKTSKKNILDNLNFTIKQNEITAIVGDSGSGKSTILKLLLGLYNPDEGIISANDFDVKYISKDNWRGLCGSVIQGGYIFSDTIAKNIALSDQISDYDKINKSLECASLLEFVNDLPLKLNTLIGEDGVKMSMGQLQRILIARALYKEPMYLFLDEPTNSLDANNEKDIIYNLKNVYKGKTVFIIAHRFSTIRNADKIIVLNKGMVVDVGTHDELVVKGGYYMELFSNQMFE